MFDHTKVDGALRRKLVSRGLLICRFPNVGGISPYSFLSGVSTFRISPVQLIPIGDKTIERRVETLHKVRPGGGCGTHETPSGSATGGSTRRQSIPQVRSAVKRRLMQCVV